MHIVILSNQEISRKEYDLIGCVCGVLYVLLYRAVFNKYIRKKYPS